MKPNWLLDPAVRARAVASRRLTHPPVMTYASQGHKGNRRLVHRARAEQALGKPLPVGALVHHADGSISSTAPLVICQDEAYHQLLHFRMRILAAGGNPNTQKICSGCSVVKNKTDFSRNRRIQADGRHWNCRACEHDRRLRKAN